MRFIPVDIQLRRRPGRAGLGSPLRLKDEVLEEVLWGMTMNDFPNEITIVIMDALADAQKYIGKPVARLSSESVWL